MLHVQVSTGSEVPDFENSHSSQHMAPSPPGVSENWSRKCLRAKMPEVLSLKFPGAGPGLPGNYFTWFL